LQSIKKTMVRGLNKVVALLFLSLFLLPSIVKIEHHHRHNLSDTKNEKHSIVIRDNCPICHFEFSFFITHAGNIDCEKENPSDNYFNNYNSRYNSDVSLFSFSLRAPPLQFV
jgi:hypothetical protein